MRWSALGGPRGLTPEQRFWTKVRKTDGCWLWEAGTFKSGYGAFKVEGKTVYAHRWAWESLIGPIPAGLELDHVLERGCVHRNCVRPAHLEPVSSRTNTLRIPRTWKMWCPHNHRLTLENTYITPDGRKRECRTCRASRSRARLQPPKGDQ